MPWLPNFLRMNEFLMTLFLGTEGNVFSSALCTDSNPFPFFQLLHALTSSSELMLFIGQGVLRV